MKDNTLREKIKALPRPDHKNAKYLIEVELDAIEALLADEVRKARVSLIKELVGEGDYIDLDNGDIEEIISELEKEGK